MKIKPLIKTHWVASQNPLTVSIEGLQRVVFSPPPELLNPDFSALSETQVELPALSEIEILPPQMEEVREVRAHTYALARDLFWTLFSGHDLGAVNGPSSGLKKLIQSLEFHFQDGQCLSLVGVFRRGKFPKFLDPKYYLQDPSCNWERAFLGPIQDLMKPLHFLAHQKKNEDFKRTWIVILEILAWSLQRKRQVGDLEVVFSPKSQQESESAPRLGFHLEDIEFLKELPLAATMMVEPGAESSARIRLWQGHSVESKKDGILRLHSVEVLSELENFFLGPQPNPMSRILESSKEEELALTQAEPENQWQSCFATLETSSYSILNSLSKLESSLGPHHVHFVRHGLISSSSFQPILKVQESEGSLQMAVSFRMEAEKLEHFNFPSSYKAVLLPFYGGLDTILKLDRKESSSRQIQYRTNDLLFLRHQGLTLFCLFELINWVLKKPLSSGEEIEFIDQLESPEADQQFEKVLQYLQNSIPALLGKPSVAYKDLISAKAQAYFLDFIERLFRALTHDRSMIFHQGRILEIRNVQSQVLPFIRFLILHFIESSRGKFLLRAQAPLSERFVSSLDLWTVPQIFSSEKSELLVREFWMDIGLFDKNAMSLLFELYDQKVEVELNGTALSDSENPFEFVFSVQDAAIKEDSNWFDLHPEIFFNGKRVSTEEVKLNFGQGQVGFIEYQGQVYRIDKKLLPSLKSLQRFWNKIKGLRQVADRNSLGDKVYRLEKSQALDLLMLKAQGFEVRVEGEWKKVFDYFETGLGTEKIHLPETVKQSLLPHQREGVQWLHDLYELKLGAILADEMGLGKTFQVLSFLTSLQMRQKLNKCLIVVPTSLVYNWVDEKKKFAPDLPFRVFQSSEQDLIRKELATDEPLVVVATYGLLIENIDFFQSHQWNVLAFDEAQNLKNITSLRSVSARKINAKFKICITGTPMENNYLEFYALCDLVVPGCLGEIDAFRREYVNNEVRSESLRELRLISKPLLLRRTKLQVKLSLPPKTIQKVTLPFGEKQKEIYKKMAMTFSKQVDDLIQAQGEKRAQIAMFAALMRLRQICSDPAAVPGVAYPERPVKVEHFLTSLQEHLENQESVVVFTQFLSTLRRIEKELEKMNVPTYTLQGSVTAKERVRLISSFQNHPDPGVMLMTLKTGGVGLNLTKASVVYHIEPWWNPAVENQATDRAHRMGQTKDVKVYNLLIEGTLEERIADLKLKKQDSFDRLFAVDELINESEYEGSNSLTREDFLYLLKS